MALQIRGIPMTGGQIVTPERLNRILLRQFSPCLSPRLRSSGTSKELTRASTASFTKTPPSPTPGDNEVLVHLRGASLNYRDLIIPKGEYPFPLNFPVVAFSDGAGEVVAVGSKVTKWKKGDKVLTLFNQGHQSGDIDIKTSKTGLGGCIDGTLRQ
ncbi:hypothetical protein QC762_0100390 [Podospora pseudocomata]|uniref:Alcohol dehydrogenase-like N-terminal domain-containing protein n=1 Tax=Podospora pseudocomata TaxID=2093779 RepID=A0ABR0G8V5_9PEZI|nr:hypothetical protein QC762_0100390 [Podospora pseudocomata]